MNFGVRFRLVALGLAFGLMGAAIVALMASFQRQTRELQVRLANIDTESGQIATQFKDRFREITNARLHYAISHDPAVWQQFVAATRALSDWIETRERQLTRDDERQLLQQIRTAYADYLRTVGQIPGEIQSTAPAGDALAAFTRVRSESQRLFDLGESLASTHYRSRNQLLAEAGQRLQHLRASVLGLLGLLFALAIALAAFAYRDLIAPLRVQLVESRSIIERNEKLASLGMLAAGVAHEIRNPLTAIKAALFIQQRRLKPGTAEHADSELVQREITRLEKIVNDFLRFARPSDPVPATVPADRLLRDVHQFFAPELEKAGIRVVLEAPEALQVDVDQAQIRQVLINLVQNAVESMPNGGTLTLRAGRDHRTLDGADRDVVILEVGDTGSGIPPEVGKRLFDPFFTTKDHGTGLGLSIAARIVEKHRGALQYQTQVNRGTTFGIILPQPASPA